MDSEQVIRIALTVVTPILTAGIGIAALVIGDWRERRTQAGQRKLAFDDASRQVAFATEWWNASKLVARSTEEEECAATRAQAWLEEATVLVTETTPSVDDEKAAVTLRRLLLVFPMRRRAARILRGFYYFFLGVAGLQIAGALDSALGRPDTLGIPNYFSQGLIYADLAAIFAWMVVAMAFRFSALHMEKSEPPAGTQRRMTLRRALLLYRLSRPAARIARIVFWCWIVFALIMPIGFVVNLYQDPRLIAGDLIGLAAFVGWTVGLRYWVVSLDSRPSTSDGHTPPPTLTGTAG